MTHDSNLVTLDYYDNNAEALSKKYESADMKVFHDFLIDTFSGSKIILELGGGTGRDSSFLTSKGYQVVYSDGSSNMVSLAKKIHPELHAHLKISFPEDLFQIPTDSYDGIFSVASLMHIPENKLTVCFQEIRRILKPDGSLCFSVCIKRPELNGNGMDLNNRFFLLKPKSWWEGICVQQGYNLVDSFVSSDGIGRENVQWLNVRVVKCQEF